MRSVEQKVQNGISGVLLAFGMEIVPGWTEWAKKYVADPDMPVFVIEGALSDVSSYLNVALNLNRSVLYAAHALTTAAKHLALARDALVQANDFLKEVQIDITWVIRS